MIVWNFTVGYEDGEFVLRTNTEIPLDRNPRRFLDSTTGRNALMSQMLREFKVFETAIDQLKDPRTDYHTDVLSGVAKPTNREDYFRHNVDHDERYGQRGTPESDIHGPQGPQGRVERREPAAEPSGLGAFDPAGY